MATFLQEQNENGSINDGHLPGARASVALVFS